MHIPHIYAMQQVTVDQRFAFNSHHVPAQLLLPVTVRARVGILAEAYLVDCKPLTVYSTTVSNNYGRLFFYILCNSCLQFKHDFSP